MPLRKQSQFARRVSSFKLEVSSGHLALHTSQEAPYGVTTSGPVAQNKATFPGPE